MTLLLSKCLNKQFIITIMCKNSSMYIKSDPYLTHYYNDSGTCIAIIAIKKVHASNSRTQYV